MAPKIVTVSLSEFADDHGVTLRAVQKWIAEGMPHRNGGGERRVVRRDANRWLREREREQAKSEVAPDEAMERALKIRTEREIKQLELDRLRGILTERAVHEERITKVVGGLFAVAAGQLQPFERDIVAASTPADARKVTEAIYEALCWGAQGYAEQLDLEAQAMEEVDQSTEKGEAA